MHNGDDRIVWFDALDIPLFRHMNAAFAEEGPPHNLAPQAPDTAFANVARTIGVTWPTPKVVSHRCRPPGAWGSVLTVF